MTMEKEIQTFNVRNYYPITTALAYAFQATVFYILAHRQYEMWLAGWSDPTSFRVLLGAAIFLTGMTLFSVRQAFKRPYAIELNGDRLKLRSRELASDEIKRIYVSWADHPVISIKPLGSWFVPNGYSFRFKEGDRNELSVRELIAWAELHRVAIVRRKGTRWV